MIVKIEYLRMAEPTATERHNCSIANKQMQPTKSACAYACPKLSSCRCIVLRQGPLHWHVSMQFFKAAFFAFKLSFFSLSTGCSAKWNEKLFNAMINLVPQENIKVQCCHEMVSHNVGLGRKRKGTCLFSTQFYKICCSSLSSGEKLLDVLLHSTLLRDARTFTFV